MDNVTAKSIINMNCYCMLCYCQGNSITTNKTPISEFLPLLSRWSNPNSASFIEL